MFSVLCFYEPQHLIKSGLDIKEKKKKILNAGLGANDE